MGIARLLAKGWIIFCLFAGAHAVRLALLQGLPLNSSLPGIAICALLFAAMGLLFVGGFGVSAAHAGGAPWRGRFQLHHLIPGFNESVFLLFVALSFMNQAFVAPANIDLGVAGKLGAGRFTQLLVQCRHAKESLLGDPAPEQTTVTVLGSGSKLIVIGLGKHK